MLIEKIEAEIIYYEKTDGITFEYDFQ